MKFTSPIVLEAGDLAFLRRTLLVLIALLVVFLVIIVKGVVDLKAKSTEIQKLTEENEILKGKVVLHEGITSDHQKLLESVTDLISNVANVPVKDAAHLASLEIAYANKYDIPLHVGLAISYQESKWDSKAVSHNGSSFGVKQVNLHAWKKTFKGLTANKLMNPNVNMDVGYSILSKYLHDTGSLSMALKRYRGAKEVEVNDAYVESVVKVANAFQKRLALSQT